MNPSIILLVMLFFALRHLFSNYTSFGKSLAKDEGKNLRFKIAYLTMFCIVLLGAGSYVPALITVFYVFMVLNVVCDYNIFLSKKENTKDEVLYKNAIVIKTIGSLGLFIVSFCHFYGIIEIPHTTTNNLFAVLSVLTGLLTGIELYVHKRNENDDARDDV